MEFSVISQLSISVFKNWTERSSSPSTAALAPHRSIRSEPMPLELPRSTTIGTPNLSVTDDAAMSDYLPEFMELKMSMVRTKEKLERLGLLTSLPPLLLHQM
ncbi:hypothetical protein U1Q18_041004 [Sarracenia purpurea var. burkii]